MNPTSSFSHDYLDQHAPNEQAALRYNPLKDRVYVTGLVLLAVSLVLFFAPISAFETSGMFGLFILHYLLVWVFMVVLWVNKRLRWWMFGARRADYPVLLLLLLLWLVSCFALNRELTLFQPSASWLNWHLGLSGLACVAFAWQERMPVAARWSLWFVLGASLVLFVYYALALMPIAAFGVVVVWFFGIPLHAFIPLVLCVYLVLILKNALSAEPGARIAVFSGIGFPLAVVAVFATAWFRVSNQVVTSMEAFEQNNGNELPRWVTVSRQLERNWLNGHLLKAVAEGNMNSGGGMLGDLWFFNSGVRENNPLLIIAATVSPKPKLTAEECRRIYTSQYDSRNIMEERLWSGDDLLTTHVQSRVMLDPGHRLSYTEKVMTVAQKSTGNSGRTATQEAIYTFFCPKAVPLRRFRCGLKARRSGAS